MLIPSIDIQNGRVVQLRRGRELLLEAGDPVEVATWLAPLGEIAVIDLDAAMGTGNNREVILPLLEIARCRVGGGIRDLATARDWLDAGAVRIILGSAAEPELLSRLPRERVIAAVDASEGEVRMVTQVPQELESVDAGVHLLLPHAVGADARRMRVCAMQTEVPLLVVCREPLTDRGLVPIVSLGHTTVRGYVDPPDDVESHDLAWVLGAQEALGDAAIESLDPALSGPGRIEALRHHLDTVPEHERLHQELAAALRAAAG